MPTRTYTGNDFINVLRDLIVQPASYTASETPIGNIGFTISGSGGESSVDPGPPSGCSSTIHFAYTLSADLDFSVFPTIPDDALITEVEVKLDVSLNGTTSASAAGAGAATDSGGTVTLSVFRDGTELMPDIVETDDDQFFGTNATSATLSVVDNYTKTQLYDYSVVPITKAELETLFTAWLFTLDGIIGSSASSNDGIGAASTSASIGYTLTNIRFTVTYTSGPAENPHMTIDPPSGNVQPGQILVVTTDPEDPLAPDLEDLTYAGVTADGRVIPIEPQIIYDEDGEVIAVWLEAPYPSSGPCLDCLGDCPECYSAGDVCNEDLDSPECQAAMQSCLDCLIECLEDLDEAEECHESSGHPPDDPTTVIVIASKGTQFGGTVPLGSFIILVANGSGLYRFTAGQTHDILYSTTRDGETYNVKIPNPGGKTGFFRS